MDVRLSPEQEALRDSAAQVADRLGPQAVGQLDDVERVEKLDAAVGASGWRELRAADEGGEPLASGVDVALVAEELGRGLADVSFLGPTLAAELRRLVGAPPVAESETVLLSCGLSALATLSGDDVPPGAVAVDAQGASGALALAPVDEGFQVVRVGLEPVNERTDLTRPTALVDPSSGVARVEAARPLSSDDLDTWTVLGLAMTCSDLVGVMGGAVRLSCEYASSRKQYGTAIGSFQAVQHMLADAYVLTEGSRSTTLHAAWAVDALPPADAFAAAAVAKAYCSQAARAVCETAIQVHGGIGNTWECLAHVFLRRALMSSDILGGVGPSLTRVLAHHGIDRSGVGDTDGLR